MINRREGIEFEAAACVLDGLFHKALLYEVVSVAEMRERAVRVECERAVRCTTGTQRSLPMLLDAF